jgi:hypothetical protein
MSTATVITRGIPRRTRQTLARERFLRRRRSLAGIVEGALDPRFPQRHGLRPWPRIPQVNRAAVTEPLQRIAAILRDPVVTVPDRTLRRVMSFVTDPASPAYGQYPNQAGFAAYSLLDEVSALSPHLTV